MVAVINWLKEAPIAFKSDGPSCNGIQSKRNERLSIRKCTDEVNESVEKVRHKNHEKVHQTISQKNMNCSVTTAALIDCAEFKTLGERTVSFLIF